MNTPIESSTVLAGHETAAEGIENHARYVLTHAQALVELVTGACNDDEVTKVCEAIVLELAGITQAQGLELEEILPTEQCQECERPSLDFRRSRETGKVTCVTCLVLEADETLEGKLRASVAQAKAAREAAGLPPVPDEPVHTRASVLANAAELATKQREAHYGPPGAAFARIATMWTTILGTEVRPHHVALCLAAMKIARAVLDPTRGDNWVDLAGYAACGGEVALARRSA